MTVAGIAWGAYSLMGKAAREPIVAGEAPVAWNLLTYAVWRDEVLASPDVGRLPGTRSVPRSLGERV